MKKEYAFGFWSGFTVAISLVGLTQDWFGLERWLAWERSHWMIWPWEAWLIPLQCDAVSLFADL